MRHDRGQTLVASLIVIVIILILTVVFFTGGTGGKSSRKDNLGTTMPGVAKYAAKDEICKNYLSQIRASVQIYASTNGDQALPEKIEDTHLGNTFYVCPVGGEKYEYDPKTGKVHCPHPGHENY
jgi:Tfp pilus assembly protein PilE